MTDDQPPAMNYEALEEQVMTAAAAAAGGDGAAAKAALVDIVDQGDSVLYAACIGWAELTLHLIGGPQPDDPLEILDPHGQPIDLDNPPDHNARAMIWALRFVQARAAHDTDAGLTLFYGDLYGDRADPDRFLDGLLALLHLTATGVRTRDTRERHDGLRRNATHN